MFGKFHFSERHLKIHPRIKSAYQAYQTVDWKMRRSFSTGIKSRAPWISNSASRVIYRPRRVILIISPFTFTARAAFSHQHPAIRCVIGRLHRVYQESYIISRIFTKREHLRTCWAYVKSRLRRRVDVFVIVILVDEFNPIIYMYTLTHMRD